MSTFNSELTAAFIRAGDASASVPAVRAMRIRADDAPTSGPTTPRLRVGGGDATAPAPRVRSQRTPAAAAPAPRVGSQRMRAADAPVSVPTPRARALQRAPARSPLVASVNSEHARVVEDAAPAPVAISIVARDRPVGTLATIRSALTQMHTRCDIYVIDRGSAPVALARLIVFCAQYPSVQLLVPGGRIGHAAASNVAARATDAAILISLAPGVRFGDPRCVSRVVARFEAEPRLAGLAFALRGGHARALEPAADGCEPLASLEITRQLGAAYAFRRSVLSSVGGYDEIANVDAEYDAARRMLELGYDLAYCPECPVERT